MSDLATDHSREVLACRCEFIRGHIFTVDAQEKVSGDAPLGKCAVGDDYKRGERV
jgi:hypothetical protein